MYQVFPFESVFCNTFFLLSDFCNQTQIYFGCILIIVTVLLAMSDEKNFSKRKILLQSEQPTTPTADVIENANCVGLDNSDETFQSANISSKTSEKFLLIQFATYIATSLAGHTFRH